MEEIPVHGARDENPRQSAPEAAGALEGTLGSEPKDGRGAQMGTTLCDREILGQNENPGDRLGAGSAAVGVQDEAAGP